MSAIFSFLQGQFSAQVAWDAEGRSPVLTPDEGVLVTTVFEESVVTHEKARFTFRMYDSSVIDRLRARLTKEPRIYVRYGVSSNSDSSYTPWFPLLAVACRTEVQNAASDTHGSLFIVSAEGLFRGMELNHSPRAWKGPLHTSAKRLATSHGYSDFLLEPTSGDMTFYQAYRSDAAMLDLFAESATSAEGKSGYLCYATCGQFHFHTVGYEAGPPLQLVHGVPRSASSSVVPTARILTQRGHGVTSLSYDALTGKSSSKAFEADRLRQLEEIEPAERPYSAVHSKHVSANREEQRIAQAASMANADRQTLNAISVTVKSSPFGRIGDLVDLSLPEGNTSLNGLYFIYAKKLDSQQSDVESLLTLCRAETRRGEDGAGRSVQVRDRENAQ